MKNKNTGASAWAIYQRLLAYIKPHLFIFFVSVLGYILLAASNVWFVDLMKSLVGAIESNNPQQGYWVPLQVVVATVARSLGSFIGAYFMAKVAFSIIHTLRTQLFNHMTLLPNRLFEERSSGHLVSVITYNINGVTVAATDGLKVSLREGATVIGLLGTLIYANWKLTLIFIIVVPFIAMIVNLVAQRLRRLSSNVQNTVGDITQVANEMINGFRVMRSFGGEQYERERFEQSSLRNFKQNMKIVVTAAANSPVIEILIAVAIAILLFIALRFNAFENSAEFIGYITAIGLLLPAVRRLGEVAPMISKGVAAAESVFDLLDTDIEKDTGTRSVDRVRGEVEFKDVCFSYAKTSSPALDKFNIRVSPGEVIALVGRSGSGKSTLVSLLPRFHDAVTGEVLIDGVSVQEYKLTNLREQIALVNQQVTLFDGTVAGNIAYGSLHKHSLSDIKAAADAAYATEFIEKLPEGFDTQIGEHGLRLSGGQRQRLAIARAILKNAPILILDEATSALDNESEHYIQAALEKVMHGRTTFVVAHRLSTIENAHRIIVMDKGEIVEQGSHTSLLALNGLYARFHAKQFHFESD